MRIGYDRHRRRAILDEIQPHWLAAAGAVIAAYGAYSQNQAAKKQQGQAAAAEVAQRQQAGTNRAPFESVASQFTKPQDPDPSQQRLSEGLAQENAQNEARLRAMQQGTSPASLPGQGAGAPPPAQAGYMAGTQVQPGTGPQAYNLSNVPQTTKNPGMGMGDYASLIGTAAQVGGSMRGQPPPSGGLPQNPPSNYTPTAMAQLQAMLAARQQQRRFY